MALRVGPERGEAIRSIGAMAAAGWAFVIALFLGLGGGYLIDRWLGTTPWFFFAGFFVGFAAGVTNLVRASKVGSSSGPRDRS